MHIYVFNEMVLSPDASVQGKWRPHTSVFPIIISGRVTPCHSSKLSGSVEL